MDNPPQSEPTTGAFLRSAITMLAVAGISVASTVFILQTGQTKGGGDHEEGGHEEGGHEEGGHEEGGHEEGGHEEGGHEEGGHEEGGHEEGGHEEGAIKFTPEQRANAHLELRKVGGGDIAVTMSFPGEIATNAEAVAHVTPRVSGTVREVRKRLGERVEKGETLALLDSSVLADLQERVKAARERVKLASANFERNRKLFDEKIGSEKNFIAAKQALAEARIEARSAKRQLKASAGKATSGGSYALVAPISGTIVGWHVGVGEVLDETTQVFTIADLSTVWINISVYARDIGKVRQGQTVRIVAEGIDEPATGPIDYVAYLVGEATRSTRARVVLDTPGEAWRPGLFVTADVAVDEFTAPQIIADAAIQTVEGKKSVFVLEDEAFRAHPLQLGREGIDPETGELVVEVLDGLHLGDEYVVEGSFILKAELGKSEAGHEH